MIKTRITEMLGIDYPIIGGTMMYISKQEFVTAISEAGALGILASANYKETDKFADALKAIQDGTNKPFAVNLNLFPGRFNLDNNLYLDEMEKHGIKIVETSGHRAPEDLIERIKAAGMTLIHKCVAPKYAKKAETIGADAVTVVGWENGGATGVLDISTLVLVPRAVDAVSIPVIGGGGVGDGRGLAAMLSLGAEAAIIGTLFLAAEEAGLHPNIQQDLIRRIESETTLVLRSIGNTHRVLNTETAKKVQEMEGRNATIEELLTILMGENTARLIQEGDINAGVISLGQSVGMIKEVKPVKDIIDQVMYEAEESMKKVNRFVS